VVVVIKEVVTDPLPAVNTLRHTLPFFITLAASLHAAPVELM